MALPRPYMGVVERRNAAGAVNDGDARRRMLGAGTAIHASPAAVPDGDCGPRAAAGLPIWHGRPLTMGAGLDILS